MIRVLQIGMTNNLGGIECYLMNYYKNIDRKEVQFDFVNMYDSKLCFQDELIKFGSRIYSVPSYYKHPLRYINKIKHIIKDNNYNIVHCNMNSAVFLYPIIAAKMAKAKIIIAHSHNSSSDKGIIKSLLHNLNKHFIYLFANEFFACSERAGEWFFSKRVRNSDNYRIINNAIEIDKYVFDKSIRQRKREELGITDEYILIGHVGRFNKQKNHSLLIDIFDNYHKKNIKSKLILVGQGPLMNKIKNKVNKLNLQKDVLFLGLRNDTYELYQAFDVFILPSLYEGLPLVGVEAQYSGLGCIFSSNISKELKITNNCFYVGLNRSLDEWCKNIDKALNICRKKVNYEKYNIKFCSKDLQTYYIKKGY